MLFGESINDPMKLRLAAEFGLDMEDAACCFMALESTPKLIRESLLLEASKLNVAERSSPLRLPSSALTGTR